MTLNWEVIKRFMTRSFEKSVDFYMLSDKNYVIPMDKMYEYIDKILAIPYIDYIDYVQNTQDDIIDEQLTQCSSFAACTSEMCMALDRRGNPGMSFLEIGRLFPQYVKTNNDGAYRKYGENQIKTSTQLGLTFEYYGYWYLTCVGYTYNQLEPQQQQSLLARTILRVPLYQALLTGLLENDVDLTKYMQPLSDSTKGRRSGSILKMINLALNECKINGIHYHNLYFPKYDARKRILLSIKQEGYINDNQSQQIMALFLKDTKVKDHNASVFSPNDDGFNTSILTKKEEDYNNQLFKTHGLSHFFENLNYKRFYSLYTDHILDLRQAKINGEVIVAKPVLLLALIDGIGQGIFKENRFVLNEWLEARYLKLMVENTRHSQFDKPAEIANPFWHLATDGFWHLHGKNVLEMKTTPSKKWLKENVSYACFDEDLWILLQNASWRMKLRDFIVENKLSSNGQVADKVADKMCSNRKCLSI